MSYAGRAYLTKEQQTPLRRRIAGIVLALAIELLIVLIILTLGQRREDRPNSESALKAFQLSATNDSADKTKAAEKTPPARTKKPTKTDVALPKRPTPPVPPPPPLPVAPSKYLVLSKDAFAAADIGKLPSHKGEAAADDSAGAADSVAAYGPGQGPGGQPLYNAEWYREPSRAELATYIPARFTTGWALIACKTAPDYRVENCQSLGESPVGSGLSRGMREAAWQFRVLPPRIGGKKVIGAWVRIRIDFTQTGK